MPPTKPTQTFKPRTSSLKPQALSLKPHARTAFTLVELLVVIAIIGILAGLISVAAVNAVYTAKQMRIKVEIDQLDAAMKAFKQQYGAYPPANLTNPNSNVPLKAFVARAFPRYNQTNLATDMANAGANTSAFDPANALVFWLSGFSPDVTQPFTGGGTRTPFFAFDKTRLVSATNPNTVVGTSIAAGGVWYLPQGGKTAPMVYFDSRIYSTGASGSSQPSNPVSFTNAGFQGTAQPYAHDVNNNKVLNAGTPGTDTWANPDSFQIISAGQDGHFGIGGSIKLYPTGLNYDPTGADNDNVANFCDKASLEDAMP